MSNEQLAHEILLDPTFCMDQDGSSSNKLLCTRLPVAFSPAFWNSLHEDLCQNPMQYGRVYLVLQEIKTVIQRCFRERNDIQHAADTFLNLVSLPPNIIQVFSCH